MKPWLLLALSCSLAFGQAPADALPDPNQPDAHHFVAGASQRIMGKKPMDLTAAIAWASEFLAVSSANSGAEPYKDGPAKKAWLANDARDSVLRKQRDSFLPVKLYNLTVDTITPNGIICWIYTASGNQRIFVRHFPKAAIADGDTVSFLAVEDGTITNSISGETLHALDFGVAPDQAATAAGAQAP